MFVTFAIQSDSVACVLYINIDMVARRLVAGKKVSFS